MVAYNSFESTMRRCRDRARPPIPATLGALGETIESLQWRERFGMCGSDNTSPFYRATVVDGDTTSVVFASQKMVERLDTARDLYVDAMF